MHLCEARSPCPAPGTVAALKCTHFGRFRWFLVGYYFRFHVIILAIRGFGAGGCYYGLAGQLFGWQRDVLVRGVVTV